MRVEADRPIDVLQRMRQREVTDASVFQRQRAPGDRIVERSLERPCQRGRARASQIRNEPLKHSEVGIAVGAHVDRSVVQIGDPSDVDLRILTDDAHVGDAYGIAIERHVYRTGVAQRVVKETHVEAIDRGVHEQIVDIAKITDDTHRSPDHGGGVGRELRQEQTDIRIE